MNASFFGNLRILMIFFFEKMMMVVFILKMNVPWANASSLRHVFMSLEKSWFGQFLKIMMQVMIFETNKLGMSECPNLTKKKSFWVLDDPKKMSENAKLHEWVMVGLSASGFEECYSALLECRMALGHTMTLTPWWTNSSHFSNTCFALSCFLKNISFVYDHETLSYSAINSLKPF